VLVPRRRRVRGIDDADFSGRRRAEIGVGRHRGPVGVHRRIAGLRRPAPEPGQHNAAALASRPEPPVLGLGDGLDGGPLAGLRVLDLGVIVFGAELGRLLADQGADVIKVENSAFPDGLRQTRRGGGMNASFAWGQRNKRGLGLDLRSEAGGRLFRDLVRQADVVLANFKPGTLEALGLSHAELSRINPRIIVSDSSAFGSAGPWRTRMGYGPLVRASCGVSALWQDQTGAFCDGATVYPDHAAAHVGRRPHPARGDGRAAGRGRARRGHAPAAGPAHRSPSGCPRVVPHDVPRPAVGAGPGQRPAARFSGIPDPPLRPAPVPGEHTRQIARGLLHLSDSEIDRLVHDGVLQEHR